MGSGSSGADDARSSTVPEHDGPKGDERVTTMSLSRSLAVALCAGGRVSRAEATGVGKNGRVCVCVDGV